MTRSSKLGRKSPAVCRTALQPSGATKAAFLPVVWETLNIARENKALLLARQGTIVNANDICAELLGRQTSKLIGSRLADFVGEGARQETGEHRWETAVTGSRRRPIPVEITRRTLSPPLADLDVYAIRDLRKRRANGQDP